MTDALTSQGEGAALAPAPLKGAFLTENPNFFGLPFGQGF